MTARIRIALIADVHGNVPALEAVAADIAGRDVSRVVNLGDLVSGPLWPRETAAYVMQQTWINVRGNHDRQVALDDPSSHNPSDRYAFEQLPPEAREWLGALPAVVRADDVDMLLCHGTPDSDMVYLLETPEHGRLRLSSSDEVRSRLGGAAARVVACAHSHQPRLVHLSDGTAIVNPGSVGQPAYEALRSSTPHVSETGSPSARYAIIEFAGGAMGVTFAVVEYDHLSAAHRAEENGRPDWAVALKTGYANAP
jgi:diadenosine tetraphosphatase ApaH/serine/threonine PP2A family protein phosphatase